MRILGVQGSPRKNGNTPILVETVLDGARDAGATTLMIQLGDMTIAECDGCHVCWKGKECPKNDDMNAVYATIAESGAVVLGTPVYWFGPTALMKAFIDRFVYFNCPENRAMANGMFLAISFVLESAAAVLMGALGDILGLERAFLLSTLILLLGSPVVRLLPGRAPSRAEPSG